VTSICFPSLVVVGFLAVAVTGAVADGPAAPATPAQAPAVPAAPAPAPPKPPAPVWHPPPRPPLYRDPTEYPPFKLTWSPKPDLKQVTGVFPSSLVPQGAVLATEAGLSLTTDGGNTWTPLAEATVEKVGLINAVAFHPLQPNTFYIGSQTKGVWVTTDLGKTFKQIGAKAKGMASDTVVSLIVYPGDPSHQTLLAVHGSAAPGISRSRDAGGAWDVVNADYNFTRLVGGEGSMNEFYLTGSAAKSGDVQNIYSCSTLGEFVMELAHDVVPTDMVFAPIPAEKFGTVYITTSDAGLYHIENGSTTGDTHDVGKLPFKDVDGWASVGVTWGPNADILNLYLYDPAKMGLVISPDHLATTQTASNGLTVSPLVKEGAMVRPNINGTVFYAVANGALSIGRVPADVPAVDLNPAVVELNVRDQKKWKDLIDAFQKFSREPGSTVAAAKALCQQAGDLQGLYRGCQMTITARLPLQPTPPTAVTADLSRFGGTPDMPLFDDGKHGDGAAGDGVYSRTLAFLPGGHRPVREDKEWRSSWPGRVALGVTAAYADGHHTGAVGVETIYTQVNDITLWRDKKSINTSTDGEVTAEVVDNPAEVHKGSPALQIKVPKGAWSVHLKIPWSDKDITSYEAVAFGIRLADGEAPKEISVRLKDAPEFSTATTTEPVPALNGLVPGADYQQVVVPVSQLIGSSPNFKLDHLNEIILSGDTTAPATLVIDGLQVLVHNDGPSPTAPAPAAQ